MFLLKTKTYKVVVGDCHSSIYGWNDKFKKTLYFLSLMSCSINKAKCLMLIVCKDLIFSYFTWEKWFPPRNVERGGWRPVFPLFHTVLDNDIVDLEKLDWICSLTFIVNKFSGLFLHPSIFSIKHSRTE